MIDLSGIGKGMDNGAHSNNQPMHLWKWGISNFFFLLSSNIFNALVKADLKNENFLILTLGKH